MELKQTSEKKMQQATESAALKHDWKPLPTRGSYTCTRCEKITMRRLGRFTYRKSMAEWTENCPGEPGKVSAKLVVVPKTETKAWTPENRDAKGYPAPPPMPRLYVSRQVFYELFLCRLLDRQSRIGLGKFAQATMPAYIWELRDLGLIKAKVHKVQKDAELVSLFMMHSVRAQSKFSDLDTVRKNAQTTLMVKIPSNASEFERKLAFYGYYFSLTHLGVEAAEKLMPKYATIPWDNLHAWRCAWKEWYKMTHKARMEADMKKREAREARELPPEEQD
jgi:hypothetical protein